MELKNITREDINKLANILTKNEIKELIHNLKNKDNNLRYNSFLILRQRSKIKEDVYCYFDVFKEMLYSKNPYHKHIAIYLIAQNAKYSKKYNDKKFSFLLKGYLNCIDIKNYILSRHTIQSIKIWIDYYPEYAKRIAYYLINIKVNTYRKSGRELILFDIKQTLKKINKIIEDDKKKSYILS